MKLDMKRVNNIVGVALKEDIGPIDLTTNALIGKGLKIKADIITRSDGIVCGLPVCEAVFSSLCKEIRFKPQVNEGDAVSKGKALCYIEGPARAILSGERTALNFLSMLCAIASLTHKFVGKANSYGVKIMDTRKTLPGLRYLEKYAVRTGGGCNHRMGLWDQVLIKDNHLKVLSPQSSVLSKMLKDLRKKVQKNIKIEIEVGNLKEFEEALKGGPDIIMLDNMTTDQVKKAVGMRNKGGKVPILEVSGNIDLDNVTDYAACRPDVISVGSITHSAGSLDLSLEVYASL